MSFLHETCEYLRSTSTSDALMPIVKDIVHRAVMEKLPNPRVYRNDLFDEGHSPYVEQVNIDWKDHRIQMSIADGVDGFSLIAIDHQNKQVFHANYEDMKDVLDDMFIRISKRKQ